MMTDDDRISTREAARLWGCSVQNIHLLMRRYFVRPDVRWVPNGGIHLLAVRNPVRREVRQGGVHREYYWRPDTVLRVRAEHKLWLVERHRRPTAPKKGTRRHARSTAMAKVTRQETQRLKILQRVAKREGTTVAKLCVDKGLGEWYRLLPTKHKEIV